MGGQQFHRILDRAFSIGGNKMSAPILVPDLFVQWTRLDKELVKAYSRFYMFNFDICS